MPVMQQWLQGKDKGAYKVFELCVCSKLQELFHDPVAAPVRREV